MTTYPKELELDRYRRLASEIIDADPRNRIHWICVEGSGVIDRATHSPTDYITDLASYLLAAANAGLIKVNHNG